MRTAYSFGGYGLSETLNLSITETDYQKLQLKLFRRCKGCSGQSHTQSSPQESNTEWLLSYCSLLKLFQLLCLWRNNV